MMTAETIKKEFPRAQSHDAMIRDRNQAERLAVSLIKAQAKAIVCTLPSALVHQMSEIETNRRIAVTQFAESMRDVERKTVELLSARI